MSHQRSRVVLTVLLIAAVVLPLGSMFLFFAARVLDPFGTPGGNAALEAFALAAAMLWFFDFVLLVLLLAVRTLLADCDENGK